MAKDHDIQSAANLHGYGPIKFRLLALVNVALVPYVWARFPREAGAYFRRSVGAVLRGR